MAESRRTNYSVKYKKSALKQFNKLDEPVAIESKLGLTIIRKAVQIRDFTANHYTANGMVVGYRVGDYRIVVQIQDEKIVVLLVKIDKREDVYT